MSSYGVKPTTPISLAALLFGVLLVAGCGGPGLANAPASGSQSTIAVPVPAQTTVRIDSWPMPIPTAPTWDVRTPYPATPTPAYPPDYKTPTPIPPEHRMFFIAMGNGGAGTPGIQPRPGATPPITNEDVDAYVKANPMRGEEVSIAPEPGARITSVGLTTLADVYNRYYFLNSEDPNAHFPQSTQVYVVEMQGVFHFFGGPYPGDRGTYHTGVEVFNAQTGDILLQGAVGLIAAPPPNP